ncbi:MAG TPA: hypothetical protein VFS97_11785 [Nitrososphaeraceae archaeon]|nr:hypothetical protein [Nitrososphaeraceae archaeon]
MLQVAWSDWRPFGGNVHPWEGGILGVKQEGEGRNPSDCLSVSAGKGM